MKHLKLFEDYVEQNINNILDKINVSGMSSLSDEELKTLKNKGVKPNWETDLKDMIGHRKKEDFESKFKDEYLEVDELTEEYLKSLLDDISKDRDEIKIARLLRLKKAFPEVSTKFKSMWKDTIEKIRPIIK